MKYKFLFDGFIPLKKCGADPASAALMAGVSGVSNVYAAEKSAQNVRAQIDAQKEENQLNRDWQTEQAEISRNWQAGQTLQQNQFQKELAAQQQLYNLQSMQQQAKFNSPVYQKQQLLQAGLNPQVYFGQQSSFSGSSAQAGGAPSAPSPGSAPGVGSVPGLSPVSYQPLDLKVPQIMQSFGSMMEGLAQAKKAGVETSFLEHTLESRIQKAITEGNLAKQTELLNDLNLAFERANFGTRLNHAFAEYKKTLGEIDLLSEKALTEHEEQALKRSTAALNDAMKECSEKEKEKLGITIRYLPRLLESEILSNRGSAAAGFGKAKESSANAAVLEQEQRIRKVAADIRENGKTSEMQAVLDELKAKQAVSQEQYSSAVVSLKKLKHIIEKYGNDAGSSEFDSELQNFFTIIGLRTAIHN